MSKIKKRSSSIIVVAVLGLVSALVTESYRDRQYLEARVTELESEMRLVIELKNKAEIEAITLELELKQVSGLRDILQSYINSLPFPAWIKERRSDEIFYVVMINTAYERIYNVDKISFEGRSDYDIFTYNEALKHQARDEIVFKSKKHKCSDIIDLNGNDARACKFPLHLESEKIGVGGVISHYYD